MRTKLFSTVALALVCFFGISSAGASVWVTDTATFEAASLDPVFGPPIDYTQFGTSSTSGRVFTNSDGGFVTGTKIRSVGGALLQSAKYGVDGELKDASAPYVDITTDDGTTRYRYAMVFGIAGEVIGESGIDDFEARFTAGRLQLTLVPSGVFTAADPTTWGFGDTVNWSRDGDDYLVPAEYDLISGGPILPGVLDGGNDLYAAPITPILADEVNVSGVNISFGQSADGVFLVMEDPSHNILDSSDDPPQPAPPNLVYTGVEGLLLESDQTILSDRGDDVTQDMLKEMDLIADWAFDEDFGDSFSPLAFSVLEDGDADFIASLNLDITPVQEAVPEPASLLAWIGLFGASALVLAHRGRKSR